MGKKLTHTHTHTHTHTQRWTPSAKLQTPSARHRYLVFIRKLTFPLSLSDADSRTISCPSACITSLTLNSLSLDYKYAADSNFVVLHTWYSRSVDSCKISLSLYDDILLFFWHRSLSNYSSPTCVYTTPLNPYSSPPKLLYSYFSFHSNYVPVYNDQSKTADGVDCLKFFPHTILCGSLAPVTTISTAPYPHPPFNWD